MRADSRMPIVVIAVIATIHATPSAVTAATEPAADSQPASLKEYGPAICARFAITTTSATTIAQPPIQPVHGPSPWRPTQTSCRSPGGAVHVRPPVNRCSNQPPAPTTACATMSTAPRT